MATESEQQHALKMLMIQALASDTLMEVEMAARKMIQAVSDENQLARNTAAVINELNRLQHGGMDKVKRQIAKDLLEAEHYIC